MHYYHYSCLRDHTEQEKNNTRRCVCRSCSTHSGIKTKNKPFQEEFSSWKKNEALDINSRQLASQTIIEGRIV